MKNTRGVELAIAPVAVIAIILIVLVVLSGFFLGGFSQGGSSLSQAAGSSNLDDVTGRTPDVIAGFKPNEYRCVITSGTGVPVGDDCKDVDRAASLKNGGFYGKSYETLEDCQNAVVDYDIRDDTISISEQRDLQLRCSDVMPSNTHLTDMRCGCQRFFT